MSALVHDSPDRAVTAIEPLTGSDNFATWKRLMTSYLKARQVWDVVSGDLQRPDCLFKYAKPITADIHPLVEPHLNGAVRQRTIEARLEVEVQAFERHREWSRREAEAYHTIFRYLSPHISIHVAGLETSRDLWNELEERYRRMELATFCELFAQLRETTGERCASAPDFVDRVRLLVHRLNAIAPGSIGDKAHIAILLTQIGPEYILVVDATQNDKDPVNPTTIGNRLSNAEQTPERRSAGPADFQETEGQYREGEGDDPLYPRTATPVDPGLGCHQPHLLGPELLQQSAALPGDAGHGGRSSGSRRDWYGEAHAPGEVQPTPGVKNVYFAPRVGMNLISVPKLLRDRHSVVAHPQNVFVQRRGRTVGTAYHAEEDLLILQCNVSKRSRERVQRKGAGDPRPCRFPGTAGGGYGRRRPSGVKWRGMRSVNL
ncbi:hypothetical protein EN45_064130 [Penicillium chrysogenum]|uniref:Uncharacterized protein n=1 Tax=Penicillium chrysogenum TaxID=5076 RepID=A0A167T3Q4_PENCH|nr:hypothetical protein EN45_064130 [Penicillium chrysogenum]